MKEGRNQSLKKHASISWKTGKATNDKRWERGEKSAPLPPGAGGKGRRLLLEGEVRSRPKASTKKRHFIGLMEKLLGGKGGVSREGKNGTEKEEKMVGKV